MAELYYNEAKGAWAFRQGLRSPYIDYFHGWFFVTIQIAHNKSVLGAVVGEECILNELGEAVRAAWQAEPAHAPGLELFDFQVMPNHFHALVYYNAGGRDLVSTAPSSCGLLPKAQVAAKYERAAHARDLPYVIGLFKSWTTKVYHRLKAERRCLDIGPKLWQESFYDELVRSEDQFEKTAAYIRNNPANWNLDRFGPVTSFVEGNLELLQGDYTAYLSSEGLVEGGGAGALPCCRWPTGRSGPVATGNNPSQATAPSRCWATAPSRCWATAPSIISTFTSYYERQVLARCLARGRRLIWVCPGGISPQALAQTAAAREAGLALLMSPVAPGTGVNKQRAIWCNQFIVKNAKDIFVGHLRAGGSLESILKTRSAKFN